MAIVGGAIAIVGSLTHGFKKPVIIHYKKSAIFSLKTGECIDPNGQTATIVSCDAPHDAEVFATFALPGSKWPGTAAVRAAASAGCSTRLTGYLNPQLAISLASTYMYPDSVAWQAGTRTVICEVRATNGQLTGSVRGAAPPSAGLAWPGRAAGRGLAAARRARHARPGSGSSTMPTGARLRVSAPRWTTYQSPRQEIKRRDAERARDAALLVHDPRPGDVPVPDAVVAGARRHPDGVLHGDDDLDQPRVPADQPVDRGHVEGEVVPGPALPVAGRVGDRLDLLVGLSGKNAGRA